MLSQKQCYHSWWAQSWPAADPSWSWLGSALLDIGEASGIFLEKPAHRDPATKPSHAKAMHMLIGISVLHNSSLFDPVSALFFFAWQWKFTGLNFKWKHQKKIKTRLKMTEEKKSIWKNLYINVYRGCSIPTPLFVQDGLTVRKLSNTAVRGQIFSQKGQDNHVSSEK